jgi:hypothetical protein
MDTAVESSTFPPAGLDERAVEESTRAPALPVRRPAMPSYPHDCTDLAVGRAWRQPTNPTAQPPHAHTPICHRQVVAPLLRTGLRHDRTLFDRTSVGKRTYERPQGFSAQVTYRPISLDEFTQRLRSRGSSEHLIQHPRAVAIDYRNGVFAGTNDIVKTVGGAEPQTVQEFVTRNKKYYDGGFPVTV